MTSYRGFSMPDTTDYAPMTTQHAAPPFSFLGSFSGFAVTAGAVLVAVAFGGPAAAKALADVPADNMFKALATTAGDLAKNAVSGLASVGEYAGFKDVVAAKTAAVIAGSIGVGLAGAGLSALVHGGQNSSLPTLAAHAAAHGLGHTS